MSETSQLETLKDWVEGEYQHASHMRAYGEHDIGSELAYESVINKIDDLLEEQKQGG